MATKPLICKSDIANTLIERGAFDRCTFKVTKDSAVLNTFNFCDFSQQNDYQTFDRPYDQGGHPSTQAHKYFSDFLITKLRP
jgi:hypothetical protein